MKKLYDQFCIVSNKTVRKNERLYKRFPGHSSVPGTMIKTKRGYFIDGHQVDAKSTNLWFNLVKAAKKK